MENSWVAGKVVAITGGAGGIGAALAWSFGRAGARIALIDIDQAEAEKREKELRQAGVAAFAQKADIASEPEIASAISEIIRRFGGIDILINNAGTILRQPAAEHSDAYWDKVMETNLNAQFILSREIGKEMLARGSGKIIFTASLLTFQGGITVPGYAASKGGIGQLTMALANEWAGKGVNVNAIAPGYISTDNTAALRADPVRAQQILARIPAGRWGEPEDFKGPAVYLASEAAAYVHGTIHLVDGGWMGR